MKFYITANYISFQLNNNSFVSFLTKDDLFEVLFFTNNTYIPVNKISKIPEDLKNLYNIYLNKFNNIKHLI